VKVTDYCPRAAPFDSYLIGGGLVGVEVGVDVGAHAEALLRYRPVDFLTLVDPWPNPYCRGRCEGRLLALGFGPRFGSFVGGSLEAAQKLFGPSSVDFVYIDQEHGGESVAADLASWWPIVRADGRLGYRNYTGAGTPLDKAVDAFVLRHSITTHVESGEIILVK
jgi:hypothetical protein